MLEVNNNHILFSVGCEAGTYIRKLCFDIGEALCSGAHMLELRRTRVGNFQEDNTLVTLQNVKDALTIYQTENEPYYFYYDLIEILLEKLDVIDENSTYKRSDA